MMIMIVVVIVVMIDMVIWTIVVVVIVVDMVIVQLHVQSLLWCSKRLLHHLIGRIPPLSLPINVNVGQHFTNGW